MAGRRAKPSFAERPGLREHSAAEAKYVVPPDVFPGFIEAAPDPLLHFWVRTEGEPDDYRPEGWRLHHVGASSEKNARAIVGHIEETNADGHGGHGNPPWKIVAVEKAAAHPEDGTVMVAAEESSLHGDRWRAPS